jgi:hypothetical protein
MNEAHSSPRNDAIERGHERDFVSARVVALIIAGLALLLATGMLLMHGLIVLLGGGRTTGAQESVARPVRAANAPLLTPDEPGQLRALRQAENTRLNSYGWVDQSKGIARIPIDRAIDILAEKNLQPGKPATREHDNAPSR